MLESILKEIDKVYKGPVTCIIPTIASTYNKKGVSIIWNNSKVDLNNKKYIEDFSNFSYIKEVDNINDLEICTIATSCLPAFFVAFNINKFGEILSKDSNISKDEFINLLTKTYIGSSSLIEDNTYSCNELISKVATKNGITQRGLDYLDENLDQFYNELISRLLL